MNQRRVTPKQQQQQQETTATAQHSNGHATRKEKEDSPVIDQSKYSHVPAKGSWEIPRKVFHYSIGFVVFYLYLNNVDTKDVYPPLTYFLMFVGSWEFLRFNIEWVNWLYCYLLGPLMRPSEVKTRINGVIYYLLGCIIVLYSFPRDIAALSIIYLSWTDPTASIFGKLWGKYTFQYGGKSLAGSMGALVTGTLVTFLYFGPLSPAATSLDQLHSTTPRYLLSSYNQYTSPVPLWIMAIYGGLVASISEGVSNLLWNLDDNLTIPVISAVLLWIPLIGFGLGL